MSLVDQQPVAHMMDEDEVLITADQLPAPIATTTEASDKPDFGPLSAKELQDKRNEFRRVRVPPHRLSPLKRDWLKIYSPIVEHLLLQVRMNPKTRMIEIRTCDETLDAGAVQKAADFVRAYCLGFSPEDSLALLRMDDLFLDTFEVKDVKTLNGDHLSRAIGRLAGKDGKTKYTIENATKTRIVLADSKIHILGTYQNIKIAKNAISSLIMGSPPGKIYANLRTIASRMKGRF
ncbi:pre-rRNA-processing protein pno1 [Coemansia sp. RSA 2523]|nr:pre-rRNA-processing protein pno1 [Coemansia sp. RSA 1591]KAJ1763750.1 pre-rRNA-processing protein pno1 [Coemansia sp. RSA 1752]KAJ1776481.1 pre-rRNA-processing protein pno1 [Coemansia sp. RSA 1824]KAJ1790174.1 pre-rRNA-processing protein pno1 [Coemansia sp. RSA 1938]KAJ1793577.1 pre-rRNA-processing protein pno1 [Coemansia sp. RSA 2167]KAJ1811202.1 pre-rRNA-processing protein pno1 [Coemansia sp. RSA 2523]KAJ2133338.1 pre-rRNA-processing protein pno1 [Coemansia sp. RSA 921]KAJ2137786.1 pre-